MQRLAMAFVLTCAAQISHAQDKEPVFDLKAILAPPLDVRVLKTTEKDGIVTEEVTFHATRDGDKSVDIFALFAYPKGARKLPAFVWNQGGLGKASTYWTDFGAKRGYAVVCIDFPMPGYRSTGGYPIVSGLELGDDPRKAPIYFGAVALLRAVSFLESRAEVDPQRIGMAGSSWGGFYTTLMAGIDPRLKAATSMFGTGNLQLGNVWWDGAGTRTKDARQRAHWQTTLDPAWRLKHAKTPVAWFTGTNDNFYWMPSISQTYAQTVGPRHLTLVPNWDHALSKDVGEQVFTWLDIHLNGKPAFVRVGAPQVKKQDNSLTANWSFEGPRRVAAAELIVSYGDGDWRGRWWLTIPAAVKDGVCTATLPASSLPCHISGAVIDADGFRSSTQILRVVPAELGVTAPASLPDYNGCGPWGGFEDEHIKYLKTHSYQVPMLSPLAKEGKQSALFKAGKLALPPIYGTAGHPHRFACWMKSNRPTTVELTLEARTPGKPATALTMAKIGTDWTEVGLHFLPPGDTVGSVRGTVTIPEGTEILMDAVSFRPVAVQGPAKDKKEQGSLSALPTAPGAHIARLKTLADNTWLQLGAPAADPKWGRARGRAWGSVMPYAPDLQAAFLFGEGVHGWYNKQNGRYMDDLWAYNVNGHRWICLYPGADVKNIALKMNADGFEVDQDGQPIPVAQMAHGYAQVTYDTDRGRFMFMPCPGPDWVIALGERRKSWGGLSKWPHAPANCSPWMYNVATSKFELLKVEGVSAGMGKADVFVYLPSLKKSFYYHGGAKDAWLYDAKTNAWSRLTPKGPPPPFGLDANACLDSKRNRIYFGGGYYPVAPGASAFWCYDVDSNAWIDLQPKGKPCMGCNRYGPNHALMHYDSANDVVVLIYHRLPQAPTDGTVNPGTRALGVYIYDPASNSWSETPLPLPKEIAQCPNGFYCPDLNAHFIHCAGDSADNGIMSVYRYKN